MTDLRRKKRLLISGDGSSGRDTVAAADETKFGPN